MTTLQVVWDRDTYAEARRAIAGKRLRLSLRLGGTCIYQLPPPAKDDGRFTVEDGPFCRHGEAVGSRCCACGDGSDSGCQHVEGMEDNDTCPVPVDLYALADMSHGREVIAALWRYYPGSMAQHLAQGTTRHKGDHGIAHQG